MTAADRKVPTLWLAESPEKMEEALKAQPPFEDDIEWTYEVEETGINFFQQGVLVEQWRSK